MLVTTTKKITINVYKIRWDNCYGLFADNERGNVFKQ